MQLQLGQLPLETQKQAPVSRTRIIDAIAISDETAPIATDIQEWIPIRAITRKAGHIDRKDHADLAKRHSGHHFLKAHPMSGTGPCHSQVSINDFNVLRPPAEIDGSLLQRVLQAQAFLIGEHLMGSGLSDVDECLALQVLRTHQFGSAHGVPPAGSTRVRR